MKKRILAILMTGALCLSMAACSATVTKTNSGKKATSSASAPKADSSATAVSNGSSSDADSFANATSTADASDLAETNADDQKTSSSAPAPEADQSPSSTDEAALGGTIANGVYANPYFGFKLTAPEGYVLRAENFDDDSIKNPLSLADMKAKGYESIYVSLDKEGGEGGELTISITECGKKYAGLDEQALVEAQAKETSDVLVNFGLTDSLPEVTTVTFAGEEHPAMYSTYSSGDTTGVEYGLYLPKGGYYAKIMVMTDEGEAKNLLAAFERI